MDGLFHENPIKMDDFGVFSPILGSTPIYTHQHLPCISWNQATYSLYGPLKGAAAPALLRVHGADIEEFRSCATANTWWVFISIPSYHDYPPEN